MVPVWLAPTMGYAAAQVGGTDVPVSHPAPGHPQGTAAPLTWKCHDLCQPINNLQVPDTAKMGFIISYHSQAMRDRCCRDKDVGIA